MAALHDARLQSPDVIDAPGSGNCLGPYHSMDSSDEWCELCTGQSSKEPPEEGLDSPSKVLRVAEKTLFVP